MIMEGILICLIFVIIIFFIISLIKDIKDCDGEDIGIIVLFFAMPLVVLIMPFVAFDPGAGTTIGIITSVDKTLTGKTKVYIKTSETEQEEYCVENKKIAYFAKKNIGKNVQILYKDRIGLFSLKKCHTAPIHTIKILEKKEDISHGQFKE